MISREPLGNVAVAAHFASFMFAAWVTAFVWPGSGGVVFVGVWAAGFIVLLSLPSVWALRRRR